MMPPHLTPTSHGYRADAPDGRILRSGFGRTPYEAVQALRLALGLPPVGPEADARAGRRAERLRILAAGGRP